jgi:hypothetical protein
MEREKANLLLQAEVRLNRARQLFLDAEDRGAPLHDLRLEVYRARCRREEIVRYGRPMINT